MEAVWKWTLLLPYAQDGEVTFWTEFTRGFNEGWDITPLFYWGFIAGLILLGIYGILQAIEWGTEEGKPRHGKKYDVLQALQENVVLSKSQKQYLSALIERFKNRNPYDPEISTEYLREFLEFSIHNLTHSPTQTLRRRVHRVPDFEEGFHVELMVEEDNEFRTCSFEIKGQDNKYVILRPTSGEKIKLEEGDEVELSYRKGNLYLRGEAEIRQATDNEVILLLPNGLHFEEQRSYQRMNTNSIPCKLNLRNQQEEQIRTRGTIEDLSAEGAMVFLKTERGKAKKNMRGTIEFTLPGFSKMELFAEIVRAKEYTDDEQELGLHFTRVNMGDRERIFQFIRQKEENELKEKQEQIQP